jgi:hypothetical protein
MRPMFAVSAARSEEVADPPQPLVPATSVTFVSQASIDSGAVKSYGLRKRVEAVKNCRNISKRDMKYNDAMPNMKVDPERYVSACPLELTHAEGQDCRGGRQALRGGTRRDAPSDAGILCVLRSEYIAVQCIYDITLRVPRQNVSSWNRLSLPMMDGLYSSGSMSMSMSPPAE